MTRTSVVTLLLSLSLFGIVLLASRSIDLGLITVEDLGSAKRNQVAVDVQLSADRVTLAYGDTRYPYVWMIAVDDRVKAHAVVPPPESPDLATGRLTKLTGERISGPRPPGAALIVVQFSAVPRRLEEFQEAMDAVKTQDPKSAVDEMYLPGNRSIITIDDAR